MMAEDHDAPEYLKKLLDRSRMIAARMQNNKLVPDAEEIVKAIDKAYVVLGAEE